MNNHQDWDFPHPLVPQPTPSNAVIQQIVTTLALLALGYYAISFFDAWPSTIKRSSYELFIYLIPSQAIYALQYIMARFVGTSADSLNFRRSDFGNQQAKAEAIQRMFGYGRFPSVLRKARSLSGLEALMPISQEIGPPGLGNWDNSCYQNSVLQGFASLPAFIQYLESSLRLSEKLNVSAKTHQALLNFLSQLNDSTGQKTTLWTPGVLKAMDSWQQQDAQEYFSRILEAIEKEALKCNNILKNKTGAGLENVSEKGELESTKSTNQECSDTIQNDLMDSTRQPQAQNLAITSNEDREDDKTLLDPRYRNPMDGMLAQILECQSCGFSEGISLTQFSCLTLNLGLRGHSDLAGLLEDYTEPEMVEGVECTACTKAAAKIKSEPDQKDTVCAAPDGTSNSKPVLRVKAKQITVGRLPKDLVIHINRSIFDDFGNQRKNTSMVRFPMKLNFSGEWCIPLDEDSENVQAVYELKCVVTHYGRHENGHYVALGKRGKDWYCFNDEIVTRVTEEEVLARGNVFMLFYEAIELGSSTITVPNETAVAEAGENTEQGQSSSTSGSEEASVDDPPILTTATFVPAMRTASSSVRPQDTANTVTPRIVSAL